jgi:hypothetical protein
MKPLDHGGAVLVRLRTQYFKTGTEKHMTLCVTVSKFDWYLAYVCAHLKPESSIVVN